MTKSQLTEIEESSLELSSLDIGVGYPEFKLPSWLNHLWDELSNKEIIELYLRTYPNVEKSSSYSPKKSVLTRELLLSVCECLGIDESNADNGFICYSGSHSLERAIACSVNLHSNVILTNPSIDIITAMLKERAIEIRYADCLKPNYQVDIEKIESLVDQNTSAIIITSPDNPIGSLVGDVEMQLLVEIASRNDITLIVDHCFCMINPYSNAIPLIANYSNSELKWIMAWDMGKTFDLDDEKAGFLFCSPSLKSQLKDRTNILQLTFPKRWLMLFKLILDGALSNQYFDFFNSLIKSNTRVVAQHLKNSEIELKTPKAGSFALLDISGISNTKKAEELCNEILCNTGVGLVPISNFFHNSATLFRVETNNYIRVCLARDQEVLEESIDSVINYLKSDQNER